MDGGRFVFVLGCIGMSRLAGSDGSPVLTDSRNGQAVSAGSLHPQEQCVWLRVQGVLTSTPPTVRKTVLTVV